MNGSDDKRSMQPTKKFSGPCETCAYLIFDEEYEEYVCDINMDEDDYQRFLTDARNGCPYYRNGDEYAVVRKQGF